MKKTIFILVLVLVLLLSACALGAAAPASVVSRDAVYGDKSVEPSMAPVAEFALPNDAGVSPNQPSSAQDRIVIMNASRIMVVDDPAATAGKIAAMASGKGGWVVSSNIYRSSYGPEGEKYYSGDITIRVPADGLETTLAEIEALAREVTNRQQSSQDVTAEYTDSQSRVRNLRASQTRLISIMENAEDTEAVAAVEAQLRQVEGEIEVLEGQIRYYDESARFSIISVSLEPYIPSQPIEIGGWHPEGVAKQALEDLVRGLQELVDVIIRLGICGIPVLIFLALIALPFVLVTRAILRRQKRKVG
jgi:peptidoglycan hydrolase CwlO-like protein